MFRTYKCLAITFLLLTGCEFLSESELELVNKSKMPLEDVYVNFTVRHRDGGISLAPGDSATFKSKDYGDGGLSLEFLLDGKKKSYGIAYLTPKGSVHCTVYVFDNYAKKKCRSGLI